MATARQIRKAFDAYYLDGPYAVDDVAAWSKADMTQQIQNLIDDDVLGDFDVDLDEADQRIRVRAILDEFHADAVAAVAERERIQRDAARQIREILRPIRKRYGEFMVEDVLDLVAEQG